MLFPWWTTTTTTTRQSTQQPVAAQLAPEVLLLIFDYLRAAPDALDFDETDFEESKDTRAERIARRSLPLVCRSWRASGTAALYQTVDLRTVPAMQLFLRTLKTHRGIGESVRRLALPLCSATTTATAGTHSHAHRANCGAGDAYADVLRRLPMRRLAVLRVPDLHVPPETLARLAPRTLVLDSRWSGCAALRYAPLLRSTGAMKSVERLVLLGAPFSFCIPGSECAEYTFPRVREMRLRGVHAAADDLRALVSGAPGLRELAAERVRAHRGLCCGCAGAPMRAWAGAAAGTLERLEVRGCPGVGSLAAFKALESVALDGRAVLPPALREVALLQRAPRCSAHQEDDDSDEEVEQSLGMVHRVREVLAAPPAGLALLRVQVADASEARLVSALCARVGVRAAVEVVPCRDAPTVPRAVQQPPPRKEKQLRPARSLIFEPVRKVLKAL